MKNDLDEIVSLVKKGGIVIFPTDTAFGIGCRIDDASAVKKLFKIRKRPENKAVPVLASSLKMVKKYVESFDEDALLLAEKYWPGGLTIVVKCKKNKVPEFVRGGGKNIGIRIPAHRKIRELIRKVGVPILAPSANFSGEKTPFKLNEIDTALASLVDGILPGKCSLKAASTVVDCTKKPWKIIRQGAVTVNGLKS